MSVLDGVVHAEGPQPPLPFRSVLVHPFVLAAVALSALAVFVVWLLGSSNPFTPAGYVGYLTKGAVFGQSRFHGIQRGPTSSGRTWLLETTNISITPYTYSEDFTHDDAVLSRDNLKIAFRVHTVWRIDDQRVPMFMDRFSTTVGPRFADEGSGRDRQGRVRQLHPRAAEDICARRGAAA